MKKPYNNREQKAQFVYQNLLKYLKDGVLDVGADECYLGDYLINYKGMGLTKKCDIVWDLEDFPYPIPDDSHNTVVCLDVLEHLENIHDALDELFRISSRYVIISLPNCYGSFFRSLQEEPHTHIKTVWITFNETRGPTPLVL